MNHVESVDQPGDVSLHILPPGCFDELSVGGGSPSVIKNLIDSERSRRMLILRMFHDEVSRDPGLMGPLPQAEETWLALERAQKAAPDAFADLFMLPQIGGWLAYSLRRLHGGADSAAPIYVDFGQINALALAAAAIADQPFTTRIPLRDGRAMIPGFGMAYFNGAGPWDIAEAEIVEGRIWLRHNGRAVQVPAEPAEDADGWWGLRRLSIGTGPVLKIWLDDLDPMRDLGDPVPPSRLSDPEAARWEEQLTEAWSILTRIQPDFAESLAAGVSTLAPLPASDGWDTRSASNGEAFGAVMCSPASDAVTLAVALAHEFMHIKLGGLMHLLPISRGGDDQCLYAPWRDDPRPLGGLIQGIYAFVGIAAFWRDYRRLAEGVERDLAEFEYVYAKLQAVEGLAAARSADGLTYHGQRFLDGLDAELKSWESGEPAAEVESLAHLVAAGHLAGWRIRHSHASHENVVALAESWLAGATGPMRLAQSTVLADRAMRHWSQGRLGLARRRIVAREHYPEALAESWGSVLTDADLALFAGDATAAAEGFLLQIKENPEAIDAWTGLALALATDPSKTGTRAAGTALLKRPEVVQAVYREVVSRTGGASPIDVASWIGAVADL